MTGIPKITVEDTSVTTQNAQGESVIIPVPKGTDITIDTAALHYNRKLFTYEFKALDDVAAVARYWKDPHEFKPSRFLDGNWPRDAFVPFSAGTLVPDVSVTVN